MKKRQIKRNLESMVEGEEITFYSIGCNGTRSDRVTYKGSDVFGIYSSGKGWTDQVEDNFDFNDTLKIIWNQRPHNCF